MQLGPDRDEQGACAWRGCFVCVQASVHSLLGSRSVYIQSWRQATHSGTNACMHMNLLVVAHVYFSPDLTSAVLSMTPVVHQPSFSQPCPGSHPNQY